MDDMMVASKSVASIQNLKKELKKYFKFHNLDFTTYLLSVTINRNKEQRSISLSQHAYTLDVLRRYGFEDYSPIGAPMLPGLKLNKDQASSISDVRKLNSKPE